MPDSVSGVMARLDVLLTTQGIRNRRFRLRNQKTDTILLRLYFATDHKVSQVDLTDSVQSSVHQIQKITEKMMREGLVNRVDGAPRGGVFICLTKKGRTQAERIITIRESGLKGTELILRDGREQERFVTQINIINAWLEDQLKQSP